LTINVVVLKGGVDRMLTYVLRRTASMGARPLLTPFVTVPNTLITPSINHPIYRTFPQAALVLFPTHRP